MQFVHSVIEDWVDVMTASVEFETKRISQDFYLSRMLLVYQSKGPTLTVFILVTRIFKSKMAFIRRSKMTIRLMYVYPNEPRG